MTKTIRFDDFRRFLKTLGYQEIQTPSAHIFHLASKDRLFFRRYADQDPVDARDLRSTRTFLDLWGLVEEAKFDDLINRAISA